MFQVWSYDGLGNTWPSDPRERERLARITGAALSTVTPGGTWVPMPFNLPSGAVAVAKRAYVGPAGGGFDPWNDVVVLLNPGGSPGQAYSWPVVATATAFIQPGSAPGFPVRDFYCGFHPGICDHLTRAEKGAGPNPCWGKPSGTCDPNQYAQRPPSVTDYTSLLTRPGLTRGGQGQGQPGELPVTQTPAISQPEATARPSTPGPGILEQATQSLGLPDQVDVFGIRINPVILGAIGIGLLLAFRK